MLPICECMIFVDDDLHNAKCDDVNDDFLPPMFGKYNDKGLCHFDDYDDVDVLLCVCVVFCRVAYIA